MLFKWEIKILEVSVKFLCVYSLSHFLRETTCAHHESSKLRSSKGRHVIPGMLLIFTTCCHRLHIVPLPRSILPHLPCNNSQRWSLHALQLGWVGQGNKISHLGKRRTIFKSALVRGYSLVLSNFTKVMFFLGGHIGICDIFIRPSTPSSLGGTTINHQSVPTSDFFPRNWLLIYDIHFFLVDCLYICLGLGTLCWCNLFYSNVALIHTLPWTLFFGCRRLHAAAGVLPSRYLGQSVHRSWTEKRS